MKRIVQVPQIHHLNSSVVWVLDSGHGINTPGKRSPVWENGTQLMEWAFNRDMTNRIYQKCWAMGLNAHILVQEDMDISLEERARRANTLNAGDKIKITLSNHANAAASPKAKGIEGFTYFGQTSSDTVCDYILQELFKVENAVQRVDLTDGDLDKEANFAILREVSGPSVLLEYGFMSNEAECVKLMCADYRDQLAEAVFIGMVKYEKLVNFK